jgi:SM-20-related protein
MQFRLDDQIDRNALRETFREDGIVVISPFLASAEVEELRDSVEECAEWEIQLKGKEPRVYRFAKEQLNKWPPAQVKALRKIVAADLENDFHFVFDRFPIVEEGEESGEEDNPLADFGRFLSNPTMLDLVRYISSDGRITSASAFCSRYSAGDYLTVHNDKDPDTDRVVAYVFGLTKDWRPEWGGLLLFHDDEGHIQIGLSPKFNSLTLFRVPRRHSVSQVASFCPEQRLSISGWFSASGKNP